MGRNWGLEQDCALCGDISGPVLVCAACERSLRPAPEAPGVAGGFRYDFPLDRLVQRFKYAGDLAMGSWLAEQLARRVAGATRPDLLVAPPLSRARLRERGFNQAHELAKGVGRIRGIPVVARGLRRVRETPAQATLGRGGRRANLEGAFECRLALRGRRVAIVDDVYTTGATTQALARELFRAGAGAVESWVVAVTPPPEG